MQRHYGSLDLLMFSDRLIDIWYEGTETASSVVMLVYNHSVRYVPVLRIRNYCFSDRNPDSNPIRLVFKDAV